MGGCTGFFVSVGCDCHRSDTDPAVLFKRPGPAGIRKDHGGAFPTAAEQGSGSEDAAERKAV